jgi:hypothetical protein
MKMETHETNMNTLNNWLAMLATKGPTSVALSEKAHNAILRDSEDSGLRNSLDYVWSARSKMLIQPRKWAMCVCDNAGTLKVAMYQKKTEHAILLGFNPQQERMTVEAYTQDGRKWFCQVQEGTGVKDYRTFIIPMPFGKVDDYRTKISNMDNPTLESLQKRLGAPLLERKRGRPSHEARVQSIFAWFEQNGWEKAASLM